MSSEEHYDFVIVGAGSAGAVLANRLSADGRHRVLVVEAGRAGHPLSRVPISFALFLDHPTVNWRYRSEPEENTNNRPIPVPRGKLLGGSSAINGLVFVRGQPLDYDTWAQMGNRGWSFEDLLPIFRRLEDCGLGADQLRARGGPVHISENDDQSPLYDALFAAGAEVGLARNPDYNGADQEGMCKTQTTIGQGRRMSTAHCYLRPARGRANLRVVSEALVQNLKFDGKRCVGVRYAQGDQVVEARASREVILSAGAVNSPQLLELSGIGRPEVLGAQGIGVRHELPGVGENFRDHIAARCQWRLHPGGGTYNERMAGLGRVREALRYGLMRKGFFNLPSAPLLAFLRTRPELETPDIQLHFVPFAVKSVARRQLQPFPGLTVTGYQLRPESRGSIHIKSADPAAHPAIRFNFLHDETDRRALADGVNWVRRIVGAGAMDGLRDAELAPGPDVVDDADIIAWMRATAETAYHPIGTCKMGNDPLAVVDDRLRLRGLDGLRVADASIMPTMVSGNTNAAAMMIGEKAADLIVADTA